MAKEILLYSYISNYSVETLIEKLDAAMGEEVNLRINSGGGDVFAGWGGVAKIVEHGDVNMKVDGLAASMAFTYCLFAKSCECLDVSSFMAHRASGSFNASPDEQALVDQKNKEMKAKMKAKFNEDKFKQITGISIDDIFDGPEVVNVWLTGKQAEQVGLVQKVVKLSPDKIKAFYENIAASIESPTQSAPEFKKSNNPVMTLEQIKKDNPAVYAEIVAVGHAEGVAAENDRINAALVFAHLDLKGVQEIIKSGKAMTQTQIVEFSLKAVSAAALKDVEKDTEGKVVTVEATTKKKENEELNAFEAAARVSAGLDKKQKPSSVVMLMN